MAVVVPKKKEAAKRAPAAKNKGKATITEISDDEDEMEMGDGSDFEVLTKAPVEKKKGGGGRKATAAAATKAPAKKRGAAAKTVPDGQRLITEALMPTASPEKKVRKMRPSPFNKKSGSMLGRLSGNDDDEVETAAETSGEVEAAVPAKARPQRVNRRKTAYVVSDSESDEEEPSEDSEFDDGDDDDDDDDDE